jgi:Tol biopolymer transport system component
MMGRQHSRLRMVACAALAIALIALPSMAYALVADGFEPDNTFAEARLRPSDGSREEHTIFPSLDQDWFKFVAISGHEYDLQTGPGAALPSLNFDTGLWIFDTDGTSQLAYNDDAGPANYSRLAWTAPADGTYYVRVARYSLTAGEGTYGLRIKDVTGLSTGTISGTVRGAGVPLAGATVAYADAWLAGMNVWSTVTASSEGTYTIEGLAPGEYTVAFRQTGWAFQYYYLAKTARTATTVVLGSGGAVTGIDGALHVPKPVRGATTSERMSLGGAFVFEDARLGAQSTGDHQIPGGAWDPEISGDGRYVAFVSNDSSVVPNDSNNDDDVFVRDTVSGETTCATLDPDGLPGSGSEASINRNGRYVAFSSWSSAWGYTAGEERQVYVRDMVSRETTCVSLTPEGDFPNDGADSPAISADGRHVAFVSVASDIVGEFGNNYEQVYVRDLDSRETTCVSVTPGGAPGEYASYDPSISADGRWVVFGSEASDLVAGDTNDSPDVFLRDMQTGVTTRLSVTPSGAQVAYGSYWPKISTDGRYVAFSSSGSIDGVNPSGMEGLFWLDRVAGRAVRVTSDAASPSDWAVSGNGRIVAFSDDRDVVELDDYNGYQDVFVKDMVNGRMGIVSLTATGTMSNGDSDELGLSEDGKYVVYESEASNLVADDTNEREDVFRAAVDLPAPVVVGTIARPWSPYRVGRGRSFEVYGWIRPLHRAGINVAAVKFYRLQKGKWVLKKTFWAKSFNRSYWSQTKYAVRLRMYQKGYYKIVATHTADGGSTLVSPVRFMYVR